MVWKFFSSFRQIIPYHTKTPISEHQLIRTQL